MKDLELLVGIDSTWSIRALLCMRLAGLSPKLTLINLASSEDRIRLKNLSETGLVPVLFAGKMVIYDSLAIVEYINEISEGVLYPIDQAERAFARSMCAELHSGFVDLRSLCPFTFTAQATPEIKGGLKNDINRLSKLWSSCSGEFMFDRPCAVDAFYSVLAYRLYIYGVQLKGKAGQYQKSLLEWGLFEDVMYEAKAW